MKDFYSKVFGWLFIGLLVTFASAYFMATSSAFIKIVFSGSLYWFIMLAEIVVAVILGARINKMKPITAKLLYLGYSILTGITFSSLFIIFKVSSIVFIFLISALIFGIFAIIGKVTKIDLSKFGTFLVMTLLGIIILEIINIFIMNNTLDMVLCIVSLVIFMGYVSYDMQRITMIATSGYGSENIAIFGAFQLYLDFINIFIRLLRLFGKERDN